MEPITIDNCHREPIHIPGAIQPHGVLLACRIEEDLAIAQVSANVPSMLERPAASLLGLPLGDLFDGTSQLALRESATGLGPYGASPLTLTTSWGQTLEASIHINGPLLMVELEHPTEKGSGFDPRLRDAMIRLQGATDISSLMEAAASELREITGFDRVMVYRFDPEWNGEVVAEARRGDLEPFLGLRYPASDIPAQARLLYTKNALRHIADVDYEPCPLIPKFDARTAAPLDLSRAYLRSVSPIHLEYLRNMGVTASMSISLLRDGELSGLFACHHYSGPHLVSRRVRDTAEYLGRALAWNLEVLERAELVERKRRVHEHESEIAHSIATTDDILDGLAVPGLLRLTEAAGAAVVLNEGVRKVGLTPDDSVIAEIVARLRSTNQEVVATSKLSSEFAGTAARDDVAAGVLAVAVSRELGEYLLWFRPSTEQVVNWAGDPAKQLTKTSDGVPRLSPRGSFALWRETIRGRSLPWTSWQVEAASNVRRLMVGGVRRRAVALRTLNARLLAADRAKDVFIATVSHELRTPLNAIYGWTGLLTEGRLDAQKAARALEIVARNTATLGRLVDDLLDVSSIVGGRMSLEIESVDVAGLVEAALETMTIAAEAKSLRIKRVIASEPLVVLGDSARIGQIFGNLLSNAIKFTPKGGSVAVSVRRLESDVEIALRDSGLGIDAADLPHVFGSFWQAKASASNRSQGLGLGLAIAKQLTELHGGTISVESEGLGRGSCFTVRLPVASARLMEGKAEPEGSQATPERQLDGATVLVVEDEQDSRSLLQQILEQEGAEVVTAASGPEALEILSSGRTIDAIVSDIGLPEMDGLHFLRRVRSDAAHRMPAVALTAYFRAYDRTSALRSGFQALVPKPADAGELVAVLASLLGRITPVPD